MARTDPARRDALPAGTVLREYTLQSAIGHGGFGIVYRAQHGELGATVAIKEYLPIELAVREGLNVRVRSVADTQTYEDGLRRFRDEARALMQFQDHPGVVSCRDFFRANGTAYMVMEYEEGHTLAEVLAEREAAGWPFEQADLLGVMVPLLKGLERVHQAGLLHRDIKPANILIRKADGHPVLIDFGASKQLVANQSKSMAPYTEGYAAMEQVADTGDLGPWTDMYGVGAVMWRMVAGGRPPWQPPHPTRVETRSHAVLRNDEDPLPSALQVGQGRFSRTLLDGIDKCLVLQEAKRVQDCRELLGLLRRNQTDPKDLRFKSRAATATESAPPSLETILRARWVPVSLRVLIGWTLARMTGIALPMHLMLDLRPPEQILSYDIQSALEGDPTAQHDLGEQYRTGTRVRRGRARAARWYQKAAEQGHMGAQYWLGRLHYSGYGVTLNYAEAARWYRMAAEQGHVGSQVALACLYQDGKGVKQDRPEAAKWLRRAAEKGHAKAQIVLGHLHLGFLEWAGVERDQSEGAKWYRRAAEQGHMVGQFCLGRLYETGMGVKRDQAEAAKWYQRAAEQGYDEAQYALGRLYETGMGVVQDKSMAAHWYRKAAKQYHEAARNALGVFEGGANRAEQN